MTPNHMLCAVHHGVCHWIPVFPHSAWFATGSQNRKWQKSLSVLYGGISSIRYKTKTVLLRKAIEVERIGKNRRHIWLWLDYLNVYTKGKNILCYWVLYSCESVSSYPPTYQKLSENKHTPLSDYHTYEHISLVLVEYLPVVSQFNPEAWKVIRRNPMYSSLQTFPSVAFMLHSLEDHI